MGTRLRYLLVNAMSGSRTLLAPIVFAMLLTTNGELLWLAIMLVIALHLTDYFDGVLARRWQVCSKLGFLMDALGDASLSILSYFIVFALLDTSRVVVFLLVMREVLNFVFLSFVDDWYKLVDDARGWTRIPYLAVTGITTVLAIYAALLKMSYIGVAFSIDTMNIVLFVACAFYYVTLIVPAIIYWPKDAKV
jgi:phosphatidylglycerophosphate synthase